MDMARRNDIQLHYIADQLQNVWDINKRQFNERHDAFELPDRQFVKLFRLKKEIANLVINIVEENSRDHLRSSALDSTTQHRFWVRYRFPGTIGCIVCTHVDILPPSKDDEIYPEHIYVNRKQYHSINVQLICDPDLRIMSVNARYPGRSHDSYIWNNCNILPVMQDICNRGHTFFC